MQLKREKNNRTRLDIDINEIDYINPNYRIMENILKSDLKDFFNSENMTNMHIYVTVDMYRGYYLSVYSNFMDIIIEEKQEYYSTPKNKIKHIIVHPVSELRNNKIQLAYGHSCLVNYREKGLTKLSKLFINYYNRNKCSFIQIQGTDYRRYR